MSAISRIANGFALPEASPRANPANLPVEMTDLSFDSLVPVAYCLVP